jgi:hypothetical protein
MKRGSLAVLGFLCSLLYGQDAISVTASKAVDLPFSKFKDTLTKFAAVRRNMVVSGSEMELQTYVSAITATEAAREQARQQAMPELIAEARKKGATAAGFSLAPILGITDSTLTSAPIVPGPFFGAPGALKTTFVLAVRFAIAQP